MLRTQVQLTEEQARTLAHLSQEQRVSKAELVRRAVDRFLAEEATGRRLEEQNRLALAIAGRFRSGSRDTARRHDAVLAEAFAEAGGAD